MSDLNDLSSALIKSLISVSAWSLTTLLCLLNRTVQAEETTPPPTPPRPTAELFEVQPSAEALAVEPVRALLESELQSELQPELQPEPAIEETATEVATEVANEIAVAETGVFPVGIKLGDRDSPISTTVRGYEDGRQAVEFDQWLIPFEDVTQALQLQVKSLEDGALELRSPTLVLRIDPAELTTDPELGLAWTPRQIRDRLGIDLSFDIADYALRFETDGTTAHRGGDRQSRERAILTEGLPQVFPATFGLTAITQRISLSGQPNDGDPTDASGQLSIYGSALGGSLFLEVEQDDWQDRSSWQLSEAQYLRQTDSADWVLGSQPTFWRSRSGQDFWGMSTVRRWNFAPPKDSGSSGFNPRQRLQARQVRRTISGEAEPGTLVRLVQRGSRTWLAEALVDSSGLYRFEQVPAGRSGGYQVELYPDGQLTADPIVRPANFSVLPGQLPQGGSALIASVGSNRQRFEADGFLENSFGGFDGFRAGLAYRHGVTESLTLGTGVTVEDSAQALVDLFYAPSRKFELALAGRMDAADRALEVDGSLRWQPSDRLRFNLDGDQFSQQLRANWRVSSGLTLQAQGNTRDESWGGGARTSFRIGDLYTSASGLVTNQGTARWSVNSRLGALRLRHRGNDTARLSELRYSLGRSSVSGHSFRLNHETREVNEEWRSLLSGNWTYQSTQRVNGRSLWDIDLGYGVGSEGQGPLLSLGTGIVPGIDLKLRYQGVSATSGDSSFRVELSPRLRLQQELAVGDRRQDNLRNRGGILIRPSLPEPLDAESADLLFNLNYKSLKAFRPKIDAAGIWIDLPPERYRLELEPAGFPLDWRPAELAYAVDVIPGQYTEVEIPFQLSYSRSGTVLDATGEPLGGARVEAIQRESGQRLLSITNGAGVYFLEGLTQGAYEIEVNGDRWSHTDFMIDQGAEPYQALDFQQQR